jgi:hypothetical protein
MDVEVVELAEFGSRCGVVAATPLGVGPRIVDATGPLDEFPETFADVDGGGVVPADDDG